jgi:hypothetical protein
VGQWLHRDWWCALEQFRVALHPPAPSCLFWPAMGSYHDRPSKDLPRPTLSIEAELIRSFRQESKALVATRSTRPKACVGSSCRRYNAPHTRRHMSFSRAQRTRCHSGRCTRRNSTCHTTFRTSQNASLSFIARPANEARWHLMQRRGDMPVLRIVEGSKCSNCRVPSRSTSALPIMASSCTGLDRIGQSNWPKRSDGILRTLGDARSRRKTWPRRIRPSVRASS